MKSVFALWVCMALCVISVVYVLFLKSDKIGYIESTRIFQEYKGAKVEREKLEEKTKEFKSKLDTLNQEVREAIIRYDGQSAVKKDNQSEQIIQLKQRQLEEYRRMIQENIQSEEANAMNKIAAELNVFLKDYGKRNNYKFIFIANPSGTIAYAEEGTDLTEDVLKELNK
ncbi:OmpH family outer membrane protein [Sphingobacterium spiritivorum]|uniref:Outer membrane protein n=1 Tax=Sphingobacterium spiritivorum ATCC 33861 TaxID=525373 RepID=D7VQF8_SPHSI|nr:OmpH family outer membrane protein [Sphingobacterium spiritivorum]EFK56009.1 outer membrane protein [Sphingobacterium spiritivorum ATCC 33861]QQT35859.1 OmpH family outer membrane protein [Sphingobacterium spiritivorum]WQD32585.1 OmpH family outer membrane protein [Sphingobacterium spiritivorum]SUJ11299.1 periplasmic chaperone [Sphingobacterium spiritivorum]